MIGSRKRTAAALLDAVIAAMLVMVTIAIATPMIVRSARIWKQTRDFQIANDELASQMDVLVALPSDQRRESLGKIVVHPEVTGLLQDAKIEAQLVDGDQDTRLRLSINWKRVGDPPPLTLVAWVKPIDGDIPKPSPKKKEPPESSDDSSGTESTSEEKSDEK